MFLRGKTIGMVEVIEKPIVLVFWCARVFTHIHKAFSVPQSVHIHFLRAGLKDGNTTFYPKPLLSVNMLNMASEPDSFS